MTQDEAEKASAVLSHLARAGMAHYGLKVRCNKDTAILQGIVDILAEKVRAGEIAGRIPGIARVENDISVCTDGRIADEDVAMEVAEELAAGPLHPGIGAEVSRGRVKLVGTVRAAAAAARAIASVSKARGVRAVEDGLSLAPEVYRDDASLVNAVKALLMDVLGAQARQIKILARHGTVELHGEIAQAATVQEATRLAESIPGVRRVVDKLRPAPDPRDDIARETTVKLLSHPSLAGAVLHVDVRDGLLVVEGEIQDQIAKRALEKILHETWEKHRLSLRGMDNRVRIRR